MNYSLCEWNFNEMLRAQNSLFTQQTVFKVRNSLKAKTKTRVESLLIPQEDLIQYITDSCKQKIILGS